MEQDFLRIKDLISCILVNIYASIYCGNAFIYVKKNTKFKNETFFFLQNGNFSPNLKCNIFCDVFTTQFDIALRIKTYMLFLCKCVKLKCSSSTLKSATEVFKSKMQIVAPQEPAAPGCRYTWMACPSKVYV